MTDDSKVYCNRKVHSIESKYLLLETAFRHVAKLFVPSSKTREKNARRLLEAIISSKSPSVWLQQCRRDKNRLRRTVVMEMTRIWQIVEKFREPSTVEFLS